MFGVDISKIFQVVAACVEAEIVRPWGRRRIEPILIVRSVTDMEVVMKEEAKDDRSEEPGPPSRTVTRMWHVCDTYVTRGIILQIIAIYDMC